MFLLFVVTKRRLDLKYSINLLLFKHMILIFLPRLNVDRKEVTESKARAGSHCGSGRKEGKEWTFGLGLGWIVLMKSYSGSVAFFSSEKDFVRKTRGLRSSKSRKLHLLATYSMIQWEGSNTLPTWDSECTDSTLMKDDRSGSEWKKDQP